MKKIIKISGIILAIIVLALAVLLTINWKDIKNFQPMASGAYAKFMCSCLFVEGRTEQQCKIWSRVIIPQQQTIIDREKKQVTSTALWYTSSAQYINKRYGCTLK